MSEEDMFYCSFVSIHYIICECGDTFPTEEALKSHLEKEHPYKKERKEYKCGVCEAVFGSEQECINHYETDHISIDIKQEHDYTEPLPCNKEDQKDTEFDVTTSHSYALNVNRNPVTVICEICGEEYRSLKYHRCTDTKNISKVTVKKEKRNYNIKKVVCEVCGKNYASNAALRYHQRVHTGERPYKCTECDKSFTMPLFLQIHIRTHTGERPYECPHTHCRKAFSNKAALLRHDRVHTGEKPYKCKQCGKSFTQSNSMKLHVTTVHLKMPAPYKSKSRKNKAKEREAKIKSMINEDITAVEMITTDADMAELHLIKPEIDLYQEETEIMYEDEKDITYEIVYQD